MLGINAWEFLILVVAGLLILGPERLPSAAAWLGRTVRQVREYANGAREQLRSELGPEFDELREPLQDLRGLRSFNPRSAVTRHLFDDLDGDTFDGAIKPNGYAAATGRGTPVQRPLQPGERAPFDPDAT
ncbi:MAG: sec-independent translocase [Actinomycetota bacterium]|nr:sec-independent translocase [Actinomycetota bacterium]